MYKIMFICHGNICRSPMAEFVCKDLVKKAGREAEFYIVSSAVSAEEIWGDIGNPIYRPVQTLMTEKGIPFDKGKRAVQLKASDAEKYDVFVCMDESNLVRAKRILGDRGAKKCRKLLSYAGSNEDVADPWYTRDFNAAYEDILRGCRAMLEILK